MSHSTKLDKSWSAHKALTSLLLIAVLVAGLLLWQKAYEAGVIAAVAALVLSWLRALTRSALRHYWNRAGTATFVQGRMSAPRKDWDKIANTIKF